MKTHIENDQTIRCFEPQLLHQHFKDQVGNEAISYLVRIKYELTSNNWRMSLTSAPQESDGRIQIGLVILKTTSEKSPEVSDHQLEVQLGDLSTRPEDTWVIVEVYGGSDSRIHGKGETQIKNSEEDTKPLDDQLLNQVAGMM